MTTEPLLVLIGALIIDRVFGEPSNSRHPVAYLGRMISFIRRRLGDNKPSGAVLYLIVTIPFTAVSYLLSSFPGPLGLVLVSLTLKLQFSWRGLEDHVRPVAEFLEDGEVDKARRAVSLIVGRDTSSLTEERLASAAVESVGDSTVDGVIGPLLYYVLVSLTFGVAEGVAAAAFYRATNTLDSMVGYRKHGLHNLGFFSARMDDLLNYLPARLCGVLFIVSALLSGESWKSSAVVYLRDRSKTPSPNAGHPISAVAGALGVRLEKVGVYKIGDERERLGGGHILRALSLVNLSILLFLSLTLVAALWR